MASTNGTKMIADPYGESLKQDASEQDLAKARTAFLEVWGVRFGGHQPTEYEHTDAWHFFLAAWRMR